MEMRPLGDSGPKVSLLGLGCNNFGTRLDERGAREVVAAALDVGVTHFDTAESYGDGRSEEFLGKALRGRRDGVVVATKFAARPADEPYRPGVLRRRILEGCDGSLRRLGTDYINLYYQHHPDAEAPLEEVVTALAELIQAGKVLYVGCSNFSAAQIDGIMRLQSSDSGGSAGGEPPVRRGSHGGGGLPVACQIYWNLLKREVEDEIVPAARRHGLGIVTYFPLESGLLTGKYQEGEAFPEGSRLANWPRFRGGATAENFARLRELTAFAEARGHLLLELALGWLAAQEGVASIIAGATKPEQVTANAAALASWRTDDVELAAVPPRV
jgi:aryl-alcohol dehydrogenase-like predicted oxidoreductase